MLVSQVSIQLEKLTVARWNSKHKECLKLFVRFIVTTESSCNMLTDTLEFSSVSGVVNEQFESLFLLKLISWHQIRNISCVVMDQPIRTRRSFCFKFQVSVQNFSGSKSGVNQEKFSTKAAQRRSFEKRFHVNRQKSPRDLLEKIPRDKKWR